MSKPVAPPADATTGTLLVIDSDAEARALFGRLFGAERLRLVWAEGAGEAIVRLRDARPDVVVLDISGPSRDGLDTLTRLRHLAPEMPLIVTCAWATTQTAIEAIKRGASDFLLKPYVERRMRDVVLGALAKSRATLRDRLYVPTLGPEDLAQELVGTSEAMQRVYKRIGQVASSDVPVLITGEDGTGKELVARAICRYSQRAGRAFLGVNCAALPPHLLELELFGYERGAFSGAASRKAGKVELCDGGTLFLGDVGAMSAGVQARLLRLIEEGAFERAGGTEPLTSDVRLIATSRGRLEDDVAAGRFRADLLYKLKVVQIDLPPLRDRRDDIPALVEYLLRRLDATEAGASGNGQNGSHAGVRISEAAIEALMAHDWPGNVRELQNTIATAYFTRGGPAILPSDLDLPTPDGEGAPVDGGSGAHAAAPQDSAPGEEAESSASPPGGEAFDQFLADRLEPVFRAIVERQSTDPASGPLDAVERVIVRRALSETQGNQVRAARLLGMSRATLRKRIERFDIVIERKVR